MKKHFQLIAAITALTFLGTTQARSVFSPDGALVYRSTGEPFLSIKALMDEHFPGVPYRAHIMLEADNHSSVMFKLLTDEPLLIFIEDNRPTDEQRLDVQPAIDSFKYDEYLHSWDLAFDLKTQGIELGLGDIYVIEALGPPSSYATSTTANGSISLVSYSQYGLQLTFTNGRLSRVLEIR